MSREEGKFCMILYLYVESKKDNKLANITEKKLNKTKNLMEDLNWVNLV